MGTYEVPIGLRRLSSAEVAQSPGCISQHAQFVVLAKKREKRTQCALLKDVIPALRAVSSNVAQRPNGLLSNIVYVRGQQLDELRDSAGANDSLCVLCGARCNVRERPGGLELI